MRNKKNRENTRQRRTITRTRQYLCGSAICLRPQSCRDFTIIREEYRVQKLRLQYFFLSPSRMWQQQPTISKNPNHGKVGIYIYEMGPKKFSLGRCPQTPKACPHNIIQVGSGRQTGSNKTRLHKTQQEIVKWPTKISNLIFRKKME